MGEKPFQSRPRSPVRRMAERPASQKMLDKEANRQLRDRYASRAYELASHSLQFWMFIICANFLTEALLGGQVISDTALIAITTGVTVNVLAVFLGVIRGLFPAEKIPRQREIKSPARKK